MKENLKVKRSYVIPENEMVIIKDTNTLLHNIVDVELKEKDKEIERLNNIINELEEYICAIEYDERNSECWEIPVRIHNKLQELKGNDNK